MPKRDRDGYTVGYIGRGFRFYPGSLDEPKSKQRLLTAATDLALAAGQPELAGGLDAIKDATSGDQVVPSQVFGAPSSQAAPSSSMVRVSRFRNRRRFGRRRRKTFRAKVGSALLRFTETRRQLSSVSQGFFQAGDGTTRVLYIANPLQFTQGGERQDFTGDQVWLKTFWLRGRLAIDQITNSLRVRILLIASHQFADLAEGFNTYGNTTTALTNPTQEAASGETNVQIFETSAAEFAAQPSSPYVGNASGIDIIDNDYVKVLGGREYFFGTQNLGDFKNIDIKVNVNRKWKAASAADVVQTDQLRSFRNMNYYWILQVFSNTNANNILAAQDLLGTFDIITYFKDI